MIVTRNPRIERFLSSTFGGYGLTLDEVEAWLTGGEMPDDVKAYDVVSDIDLVKARLQEQKREMADVVELRPREGR